MRCTHCGSVIPPGIQQCPICGSYIDTREAQEDFRVYQEYPKTNYQQGVPPSARAYDYTREEPPKQYATPAFHTYRKQLLHGLQQDMQTPFQTQSRESFHSGGSFVKALSDLPGVIKGAFSSPMDTLLGMIRQEDRITGGLVVLVSLLMAFLSAIVMARGVLGSLLSVAGSITGLQLADNTASLHQGVSYMAGKVALPIGGIAVVCQLIAVIVPVAVTMIYLSIMRRVKASFVLLSGFTAIIVLPNLMAMLLAAVLSMITPYLSIVALGFGLVYSYVMLCSMATQLANLQPQRRVQVQASLICISELTKLLLIVGIGGALMNGVIRTLTSLTNSMGGLL